jgi:hypothetical protein
MTTEDSEEWREISGHPGYEVSSLGRVKSVSRIFIRENGRKFTVRGRILRSALDSKGYLSVALRGSGIKQTPQRIHKLVAVTFLGPCPEKMEVRHLNGSKLDNRKENLCYGTRKENALDMLFHGQSRSKLNWSDVDSIRFRLWTGEKQASVAMEYKISKSVISRIARGVTWVRL